MKAVRKLLSLSLAMVVATGLLPVSSSALGASGAKSIAQSTTEARVKAKRAYRTDEVLVVFEQGATVAQKSAANGVARAVSAKRIGKGPEILPGLVRVKLAKGQTVEDAIAKYSQMPGVKSVQPNYVRTVTSVDPALTPGDPMFSYLWGLKNTGQKDQAGQIGIADADIDAPEAWGIETGSANTIVAVIDTGVDYLHPELDGNMWHNPGEIAGDNIDNDGNGYKDDVYGIDPLGADQSAPTPDTDPMDVYGHGTHVAGTIGAEANNGIGVAGVNWDVSIMALKMFDDAGSSTSDDASAIECIQYAKNEGAKIINASWGGLGGADGDALGIAIQSYGTAGGLFVCAAGNNGFDIDINDAGHNYFPAEYSYPCIFTVSASDNRDQKASFSNYGATKSDVFAPGVKIGSSIPRVRVPAGATVFSETWDATGGWPWSAANYVNTPWYVWAGGADGTPRCAGCLDYGNNENSYVDSNNSANMVTPAHPILTYKFNIDTEYPYDYLTIYVTDDNGTNWYRVGQWTGNSSNLWIPDTIDLSAFQGGAPLKLSFGLESDTSVNSADGYEGVRVDTIRVTDSSLAPAYDYWNGTSMATPHVAGIAALLKSYNPALTAAQLKAAIMNTVDVKPQLTGYCVTNGRVNAYRALQSVGGGTSGGTVTRIAGADRFNVAASLARKGWDPANTKAWPSVSHIIVANGETGKEADPLSAAGLAGAYNAPVLLTQATRVPTATKAVIAEIAKRNPGVRVHLIGGTSSLPDARWNEIKAIPGVSGVKDRISGADRYSVSAAIAKRIATVKGINAVPGVLLIAADNPAAFYDALAVSPAAFSSTMPMLSVKKTSIPGPVGTALSTTFKGKPRFAVSSSTYIGSPASGAVRLATSGDRYVAATQITNASITRGWGAAQDTGLAAKLPDALTGGAFLGKRGGVLLFTGSTSAIAPASRSWIVSKSSQILSGWVLGGTASVPSAQETAFRSLIQ